MYVLFSLKINSAKNTIFWILQVIDAAPKPKSDQKSWDLILERLARAVTTKPTVKTTPKTTTKLMAKTIAAGKSVSTAKTAKVEAKKMQISTKKISPTNTTTNTTTKKPIPTMATSANPTTVAKKALSGNLKTAEPIQKKSANIDVTTETSTTIRILPDAGASLKEGASKSLIGIYGQFLDPKVAEELDLKNATSLRSVLKALPSAVGKYHSDVDQVELNKAVDIVVGTNGFSMQDLPSLIDAYRQSGLSSAVDVDGISKAHTSIDGAKEYLKKAGLNIFG